MGQPMDVAVGVSAMGGTDGAVRYCHVIAVPHVAAVPCTILNVRQLSTSICATFRSRDKKRNVVKA